MLSQVVTGDGGNTSTPSPTDPRARRWCGTLNNYEEKNFVTLSQYFESKGYKYIIGKEVGEDKKTPHLQFYFEAKGAVRFGTLQKLNPRIHWEVAKGNSLANYNYCKKEGNYIQKGLAPLVDVLKDECLDEYKDVVWKPWQEEVISLLNQKPDNRTINWYWEDTGNVGKSFLCKYIVCKYGAIIADGKKENVFNQVLKSVVDDGKKPRVILLDVPRYNLEYINYGCLEQLKNGLIYSGKYEGGQVAFPSPHVIVFANVPPDIRKFSLDRWNIKKI